MSKVVWDILACKVVRDILLIILNVNIRIKIQISSLHRMMKIIRLFNEAGRASQRH